MLDQRLGDQSKWLGPGRIVYIANSEACDCFIIVVPQFQKTCTDIERGMVLLKLLVFELERCLWVVNTL
ncbi:hypothetical protein ADU20_17340 [Burkholderia pseudomallei]|nr:hypothetical protein ADU20_17340 [Burkholderia pseudomallei]